MDEKKPAQAAAANQAAAAKKASPASPASQQSGENVVTATRGLPLYMERAAKSYRDQFRGAFGPYPAVQLFRVLGKLCTDYADLQPDSSRRCRDYAARVYKQLKEALIISENWWKVLHHEDTPPLNPAGKSAVAQMMTMSAIALHLSADILFLKGLDRWDELAKERMGQFKRHYEELLAAAE